MSELPLRQVHLDFHTSAHIPDVGARFDPEEFAGTLEKAHVDSVTLFARCHHGYLYYDSKAFPERVHPELVRRDLLKAQIAACRKKGIRAPIYLTVQWDEYTAREHPEWLSVDKNGAYVGQPFPHGTRPLEAGFYRALCLNSPYRAWLYESVREILEMFDPVDGLFFDIIFVNDCACPHCLDKMPALGIDPAPLQNRLDFSLRTMDEFVLEMSAFVRSISPDCSIFYNKSHIGPEHRPVIDAYSHFELESLPSGGSWGYMHFPVTARYARTLGKQCLGMTGKFHTEWGDFRSYKNKAALEYEVFRMLALGAACSVGDQLEPHGRLVGESYELIGSVYEQVEKAEKWLKGAKHLAEIGVLTPEEFRSAGDSAIPLAILGTVRMLTEAGHQFDIVDSKSDFSRYKLLLLPDRIPVCPSLNDRLNAYLDSGGAVIASFLSGCDKKETNFAFSAIPAKIREDMTLDMDGEPVRGRAFPSFDYADYLLPRPEFSNSLRAGEHVMYIKGTEIDASPDSIILADAVPSYFDRTYRRYCSHRQTPPAELPYGAAVIQKERVIYFAHPIFTQYAHSAPLWCKQMLLNAIKRLLPRPLLTHGGPSSLLACVNRQEEHGRDIIHLLHYIPERRCEKLDIIEDAIPLYNVALSLNARSAPEAVYLAPEGEALGFDYIDGRAEFTVPKIDGHQLICVEYHEVDVK